MLNASLQLAQYVVRLGSQVIMLGYVLRRIEEDAYGVFLLALGLEVVFLLMAEAISKGCTVHVAAAVESGSTKDFGEIVSSAIAVLGPAALIGVAMMTAASCWLPRWMGLPSELQAPMQWLLILGGLSLAVVMPLTPFVAVCRGIQRYDVVVLWRCVGQLVRLGLVILLLEAFPGNITVLMLSVLVGNLIAFGPPVLAARRLCDGLPTRLRLVTRPRIASLVSFGLFLAVGSLANTVSIEAIKWIIGSIDLQMVTHLTISIYIAANLQVLILTVTTAMVPVASRYHKQGRGELLAELFVLGTRYSLLLGAAVVSVVLGSSASLFSLWLKPDMAWLAPYAMVTGAFFAVFGSAASAANQLLNGMGDSRRPCWTLLIRGGTMVVLCGVGVPFLGFGLAGAVASVCFAQVVYWAFTMRYAFRSFPLAAWRLAWEGYAPSLVVGAATFGLSQLLLVVISPDTWGELLLVWMASGTGYLLLCLPFVRSREWSLIRETMTRSRTGTPPSEV